jgi:hypothetical protein
VRRPVQLSHQQQPTTIATSSLSMADTATDNQPEPAPPTDASAAADNFGDLLAQLLQTLPAEASRLFLMALSGLSPGESAELCRYVDRLRDEKQFRVIKAMAESTVEGKKKFILNLRKKFLVQQAKLAQVQAQEEHNMESHLKRKQALNGAPPPTFSFHAFDPLTFPCSCPLQPPAASRCSTAVPTSSTHSTR